MFVEILTKTAIPDKSYFNDPKNRNGGTKKSISGFEKLLN
jgi:hypothetical protein